jgi:hypothetical protein
MSTRLSSAAARALTVLRWTETDARLVLDALAASGLTRADFARLHQLSAQRLYVWHRRLAGSTPTPPHHASSSQDFVEVSLPTAVPFRSPRVELLWPAGPTVRFEGPLDPETLRTVLRVLREQPPC